MSLERFACYLFQTIPRLQVKRRRRGRGGEVDVIVRNNNPGGSPLPWLGEFALIECKHRRKRVTVPELEALLAKLTLTAVRTGFVISPRGLTGRGQRRHAEEVQDHAFSRSNVVVVSITLAELSGLRSLDGFLELLQSRYEDVRLGRG